MSESELNQESELIGRTDKENDRVIIGDTAITLRGEDGRKVPIDHASSMDGYVAFTEGNLHLTFEEAESDEVPEIVRENGYVPEYLEDAVRPEEGAQGYLHIGCDDAYHPLGGYWIPVDKEHSEIVMPPNGELIRYPADEGKDPVVRGKDELPDWVEA